MLLKTKITTKKVTFKTNGWRIVGFVPILCLLLVLFIGCKKPNEETNMVLIPAGEFEMGNNDTVEYGPYGPQKDESPAHTVYIDAFYIDIYEVTNADFKKFLDANPEWQKENVEFQGSEPYLRDWEGNNYPNGKGDHPVSVNWYAAMAYSEWVGKRLPTEAEWEKAARGGLKNKDYPWGNFIHTTLANFEVNHSTAPVRSYFPNKYGLYNVVGNVAEWCLDEYQADFYKHSPKRNPIAGVNSITDIIKNYRDVKSPRVLRGGDWVFGADSIRISNRSRWDPEDISYATGFRCVKPVKR